MNTHPMRSLHILSGDVVEFMTERGEVRQARVQRETEDGFMAHIGGRNGVDVYITLSNYLGRVRAYKRLTFAHV